jgi:hypothetical protein
VLAVSADGARVAFGYEVRGRARAVFSLAERRLVAEPAPTGLASARTAASGLAVEAWENAYEPTLNGVRLALDAYEFSRSIAVAPDGGRFALGTEWSLRLFGRDGRELWRRSVPGTAWAVNVTGDGRLVVAAYGDGTIRWHRLSDGEELLALYPHADRERWVLWTPRGHYAASPGGEGLIRLAGEPGTGRGAGVLLGLALPGPVPPAGRDRPRAQELDVDKAVARADAAAGRRDLVPAAVAVAANAPPTVTILEPGDGARVDGDLLRLSYVVEARPGSRVKQVRILLDGQDVLAQSGFEVPAWRSR